MGDDRRRHEGGLTSSRGTPVPVDVSWDRRARRVWLVFLAGPLVWFGHFMLVYMVAEAGCTGSGEGLVRFDPPVPAVTTILATVVAVLACGAAGVWADRWRRRVSQRPAGDVPSHADEERAVGAARMLSQAGLLLAALSALAVLFVGVSALVFPAC